jgi:hypothetical protein
VARGDEWRVTAALLHGPLHRGIHPRPRWRPRWPATRRSGLLAVTSGRTLQVGLGLEYFEYLSAQSQCRSVIFSLKSRNLIGLAVTYSALSCLVLRAMVSNPADKANTSSWRSRASSVLTTLTHGSAPFITTFLLVHLTAPAAANLGGSALSSQTMVRFFLLRS